MHIKWEKFYQPFTLANLIVRQFLKDIIIKGWANLYENVHLSIIYDAWN